MVGFGLEPKYSYEGEIGKRGGGTPILAIFLGVLHPSASAGDSSDELVLVTAAGNVGGRNDQKTLGTIR